MFGFLGSSTDKLADQDVSPLSELAVQVYNAVSSGIKSIRKTQVYMSKMNFDIILLSPSN